jgi:hypothetical protein
MFRSYPSRMQLAPAVTTPKGKPLVPVKPKHDADEKPFVRRLRQAMARAEFHNNYDFGAACGIHEGTIRHILRGGDPRLSTVILMADALDVSLEWLIRGEGKPDD